MSKLPHVHVANKRGVAVTADALLALAFQQEYLSSLLCTKWALLRCRAIEHLYPLQIFAGDGLARLLSLDFAIAPCDQWLPE